MNTIGLDIGTTSICGVRINAESGKSEKTVSAKNDFWIDGAPFERLQDAEKIFDTVLSLANELKVENTAAIGITGQMHGIVYLDKSLRAVSPLFTWQDGRGNLPYKNGTYASFLNSFTGYGNVTHFYNETNKIIPESAVLYCTIHDYAAARLAGRKSPVMHVSDASSLGGFDIKNNKFAYKNPFLPETTDTAEKLGEWHGIPVYTAIGDNQASFIGSGCNDGCVLVNIGTGSQVSFSVNEPITADGLETRPLSDGKFIAVGSSLCGGRAYAVLEGFFEKVLKMCGVSQEPLYEKMADEIVETYKTGISFDTRLCGTRKMPEIRGSIKNISTENFTPRDMILGCMHGIANELYCLYKSGGTNCTKLIASGNGIRKNRHLQNITENTFGMKLHIPSLCEEAAAGAAIFAMTGCGIYKNLETAERIIQYDLR